jgi:hypothetical protein
VICAIKIAAVGTFAAAVLLVGCGGRTASDLAPENGTGGVSGSSRVDASGKGSDVAAGSGGSGRPGTSSGGAGGTNAGGAGGFTSGSGGTMTAGGASGSGGRGGTGGLVDANGTGGTSIRDALAPEDAAGDVSVLDGCMPIRCSPPGGTYCGRIGDGCGRPLDCGLCPTGLDCGSRRANICSVPCPLCRQVPRCETGTTTLSGTAVTGASVNPDPVYQALVFIPNITPGTQLPPFIDGPSCTQCIPLTTDEMVAGALTGPDGTFTLHDVPAGTGIPLVVQLGHWRYQTTVDIQPCVDNPLPLGIARLPRTHAEGSIPLTAISTGRVDALECIFRKMGVADTEFSNPAGAGRIHLYRLNGATYDATTPTQDALVGATPGGGSWNRYDQILFPCEGQPTNESAIALENFVDYTNKGGRVFATHFSYTWLYTNGAFATAGQWQVDQPAPPDPLIANVDTSTPKGADFATWLRVVGALSNETPAQVSIADPRHDLNAVSPTAGGQRWIYADTPPLVQHMTIETPVSAPGQACGRVIFSDFHVADGSNMGVTFPNECGPSFRTAQEKILEFMLLDLASCGPPKGRPPFPDPPPAPRD